MPRSQVSAEDYCAQLPDGAVTPGMLFEQECGGGGVGKKLTLFLSHHAVWTSGNGIQDAGTRDLGAACAAGGLPQLTSLNLSGEC